MNTTELKTDINNKEILEKYVNLELDDIKDDVIKNLVKDRQQSKLKIEAASEELKQYMKQIQKRAANLQAIIADANGVIKYVDSKIVYRHNELI